jgi:hypothetical protein
MDAVTVSPDVATVLDGVDITGTNSSEFTAKAACVTGLISGTTIQPGTVCKVSVTFNPTDYGGRNAILTLTSHKLGDATMHQDVVALIGAAIHTTRDRIAPYVVTLPFTATATGAPTVTPVMGTNLNAVTITPTVTNTQASLTQLSEVGTLIIGTGTQTMSGATLGTSVGTNTLQFQGTHLLTSAEGQSVLVPGRDSLTLVAAAAFIPPADPTGLLTLSNDTVYYVASGTGRFYGAQGGGKIVSMASSPGMVTQQITGTITLLAPTYIYLSDLIRAWGNMTF